MILTKLSGQYGAYPTTTTTTTKAPAPTGYGNYGNYGKYTGYKREAAPEAAPEPAPEAAPVGTSPHSISIPRTYTDSYFRLRQIRCLWQVVSYLFLSSGIYDNRHANIFSSGNYGNYATTTAKPTTTTTTTKAPAPTGYGNYGNYGKYTGYKRDAEAEAEAAPVLEA